MIMRYGMSDALGLATFEAPRQALLVQGTTSVPKEYSEETARLIDAEIYQLLEAAHARVRETLLRPARPPRGPGYLAHPARGGGS